MNLYHYCPNAAFVSIISHREIWASDFSLSNDALEGRWIREIFAEYCSEKKAPALAQSALLDHLDILLAFAGAAGFCMSEEPDLLSQWRAYADNGAGVSIGFSKEYFETLGNIKRDRNDEFNASITKVEYDIAKQKELISEHADEILELASKGAVRKTTILTSESDAEKEQREENFRSMSLRFLMFFFYMYQLKNPAFAEEREWRLISHLFRHSKGLTFGRPSNMDFRALPDRIVPFRRITLEAAEQSPILEIVLGPRNITPEPIIEAALEKYEWPGVSVRRSRASYR